jgi:pSer/pThr/pTyr-binding forkhead associated (FHA) protein
LITCNRCGKENQDHYKFCLGCGNELARAAAAAPSSPTPPPVVLPPTAPATTAAPSELETSRTVHPSTLSSLPSSAPPSTAYGPGSSAAAGELQALGSAAPGRPKSGIPWNDSPKMPAPLVPPSPFTMPAGAPSAASQVTPPPRLTGGNTPGLGGGSGLSAVATTPALVVPAGRQSPGVAVAVSGEIPCPNCGKVVQATFAFCGSCGARIARAPSGPAATGGQPRTMYMVGGAAPAPSAAPRGRLVLIRPDGSEGGTHALHDGENLIGRGQGSLFDADAYLSPRHAELAFSGNGLTLRDLKSLNGIFMKISGEEPLESGDIFRIGQELLRFEIISPPQPLEDGTEIMGTPNPGFWGRLSVIVGRDVDGSAFPLFGDAIVLGRERGDILFPEDGYVSGTHARIALRDGRVYLSDLGSSNGTFLRLRHERTVSTGAFVLMGQQLFRLEYR